MANASDFNHRIVDEFRANDGKVGGAFAGRRLLLLHTTGAKSGRTRVNPLVYRRDGENLQVFGTKGGSPTNPDWYHNLLANPRVTVELGTERYEATARVTRADERDRLWEQAKQEIPGFAEYEQRTDREVPVIVLERAGRGRRQ
jgi:deazaflavin-dependent oxidoreductase (nitroreductase family)